MRSNSYKLLLPPALNRLTSTLQAKTCNANGKGAASEAPRQRLSTYVGTN